MKKKRRSRRGMTITEMLIAVLLLAMMSLGVAVGVSSSVSVYRESTLLSDSETLCSTLSEIVMDELRFATEPEESPPRYTSTSYGSGIYLTSSEGRLMRSNGATNTPLLGSGAYTGLYAGLTYSYDSGVFDVTINIYKTLDDLNDKKKPVQTAHFYVKPQVKPQV